MANLFAELEQLTTPPPKSGGVNLFTELGQRQDDYMRDYAYRMKAGIEPKTSDLHFKNLAHTYRQEFKEEPDQAKWEEMLKQPFAGMPVGRVLQDKIQQYSNPESTREGAAEAVVRRLPIAGQIFGGMEAGELAVSARRVESGTYSEGDVRRLADYLATSQARENDPFWTKTFDMITRLPGYAVEFGMTGGAASAGAKAGHRLALRGLGEAAKTTAGRAVVAGARGAVSAGARVATLPGALQAGRNIAERSINEDVGSAAGKGLLDTYIELASEQAGGLLAKPLGKINPKWLAKVAERVPNSLKKPLAAAGQHGVVGEMFEERVGDVARSATGLQSWEDAIPSGQQLASEAIAFSVPGAVGRVAGAFARENPQAAAELASKDSPSRRDFEKAGLPPATSKEERQAFVEELRRVAAQTGAARRSPAQGDTAKLVSEQQPAHEMPSKATGVAQEPLQAIPASREPYQPPTQPVASHGQEWPSLKKSDPIAILQSAGVQAQPSQASTDTDREIESIFGLFGKKTAFVSEPTGRFRGISLDGETVAMPSGQTKVDWNAIGDELAHATGIDKKDYFSRGEVEWAKAFYVANAVTPEYAQQIQANPELWEREARAALIGRVFEDAEFRKQLLSEQPSMFRKIVDAVLNFFRGRKVDSQEVQAVLKDLRAMKGGVRSMKAKPAAALAPLRPGARPDLANPVVDPQARELVGQVDTQRTAVGQPETRSDDAVEAEANQRLQSDPAGEWEKLKRSGASGSMLNDVDTVVAKKLLDQNAVKAIQSRDTTQLQDAVLAIDAYRRTGTEQARAFRQRRDPLTLAEAILTPPKGVKTKDWGEKIPGLLDNLESIGIKPADLERIASNPEKAARTLGMIQTFKADKWDAVYEYWRNAILSAPTTQTTNVLGTVGHSAWHYTAERMTEALVNKLSGQKEGAQFGEFKYLLKGVLPGISRGAGNFLRSWNAETPFFEDEISGRKVMKIEEPHVAIKGSLGRAIRMPQRLMLAADEFLKSVVAQMEVGAQAYRRGKAEGLKGDELSAKIQEEMADYSSESWQAAMQQAREMAFQQEGGRASQAVKGIALKARSDIWGLRYILPFITTPINIFETGLKKTPLGAIGLTRKILANKREGRDLLHGATADVATQVLSWAVVAALMGNDPDDPWITGGDSDQHKYSIRIGDKWHSYARLEPFATAIGLGVDWVNAIRSPDPGHKIKAPFESLKAQAANKTFLSGMSDFLRAAAEKKGATESVGRWASGFAVSWIPNIVRSTSRGVDDEVSERGVWGGSTTEWLSRLGKRTLQRTELPGMPKDMPKIDMWGNRVEASESPAPYTDWLYRVLSPSRNEPDRGFVGDKVILRWKNQHPEDVEKLRLPPSRSFTVAGNRISMTDEQYAQFAELAGSTARKLVESGGYDEDVVSEAQFKRLSADVEEGRRIAKEALAKEWQGKGKAGTADAIAMAEVQQRLKSARTTLKSQFSHKRQSGESLQEYQERRQRYLDRRKSAQDVLSRFSQ